LHVIVDTREPKHFHKFLCEAFPDESFELTALSEGDFATDKVIVERKTISDLYGSIIGSKGKPGRLPSQVARLSCHDKVVLILVVGSIHDFIAERKKHGIIVNADILYSTMASVSCRERIHILWMEHEWDALITMVKFMQAVEDGKHMVPSRRDPDMLLARYFKITQKQWYEIKGKFKSINDLGAAPLKDLMVIKGIGKVKAQAIKDLIYDGWK
jgi:ERCC4-type nuclease